MIKKTYFKVSFYKMGLLLAVPLVALVGFSYQFSPKDVKTLPEASDSPMAEQYKEYAKLSHEEREKLPKYDSPSEAVFHNYLMTRNPSTGEIPQAARLNAYKTVREMAKNKMAVSSTTWEERGPNNVGGRTRALMFDPNDASGKKVWAGGAAGGLWYNNDITSSNSQWQNIDDFWANMAISCIAYNPANTQEFYVGTGEGFFNADAVRGAGIWKTADGGTTWAQIPSTNNADFHYVQKVAVSSSGTIMAATREGLFRSTNNGNSWNRVISGKMADIEIASNGDVYVAKGIIRFDGAVYKSTNDGVSFSEVTPPGTGGQRIELAIAPSDPDVVYAVASNSSANVAWLYKTTNGGGSWTSLSIPKYLNQSCSASDKDFTRGQAWYDLILAVHPTNPNIVLTGGIDIHKSTDGGSSWKSISYWTGACGPYVHADQHAMAFSPTNNNAAVFGNDGGVSYSSNVGSASKPSFYTRNNGYNVTQFYGTAARNQTGDNYFLAGAQDNGSHKYTSAGINSTSEVSGGDGGFCHIDQKDPDYQITSYVYNYYYRSKNGGGNFTNIVATTNRGRFINPHDYDSDAKVLYAAGNADELFRVSGITSTAQATVKSVGLGGGQISAVIVSPHTANRVFVGTEKGTVYRIDNANGTPTATNVGGSSFPSGGYVSCVELGKSDDEILVTFSSYGVTSVWESKNGGSTWSNKESNLPDMPIRWALYNPQNTSQALLATELGVWSTDNLDSSNPVWKLANSGLANVRCDMLQYRAADGLVAVATHGRGLYTGFPFTGTPPACDAPSGLSVTATTTTTASLSWSASSGANNYTIRYKAAGDNNWLTKNASSTSLTLDGLTPSTSYEAQVRSNCDSGSSDYSASVNFTTGGSSGDCTDPVNSFPYTESFENGLGRWVQGTGDNIDWSRNSGGTPSSGTGPSSGSAGDYYMFIESSSPNFNKVADLESPCFDLSGSGDATLLFAYHMYGVNMGTLELQISMDNGGNWSKIWSKSGDQGNAWNEATIDLSQYDGTVKLRFKGTTGDSWKGDMAIDNIRMKKGGASNQYCSSKGSVEDEWINRFRLGTIDNNSGANDGYADFTAQSTTLNLGKTYSLTINPAWSGSFYKEAYAVWIDYNKDGDFNDAGEQVFSKTATTDAEITGSFTVPTSAQGATRLRVSMRYNQDPAPCETFSYGEVEDYTVNFGTLMSAVTARAAEPATEASERVFTFYPNPVEDELYLGLKGYEEGADVSIISVSGQEVWSGAMVKSGQYINVSGFKSGAYVIWVSDGKSTVIKHMIKK